MMKYILAITGASGIIYGVRLSEELKRMGFEVYAVMTEGAKATAKYECKDALDRVKRASAAVYSESNLEAPMASGSAKFDGMVVAPCSTRTLASIANGLADNLVSRAALVQLKERRKLILLLRETPLSTLDIMNMLKASIGGAIVVPASPGFYSDPRSIDDIINFMIGKVMDLLGIEHDLFKRWKGPEGSGN